MQQLTEKLCIRLILVWENFCLHTRPNRPWDRHTLFFKIGTRVLFPRDKAAWSRRWPLTSSNAEFMNDKCLNVIHIRDLVNDSNNCTNKFNVYGPVHCKNIPIYIQQDATLHSLLYLETALRVSGGTSTHHQERIQLYLQHLVFVTPLLLSAAIVEELELVWVCRGWRSGR